MNRVRAVLDRASKDLHGLGLRWALVDGLAVSARAEPRFTRDIDLAVAVQDDGAALQIVQDLRARGYAATTLMEQEDAGRLAAVRLRPPGEREGGIALDLLFASSGIEPETVSDAAMIEVFEGLRVPVARIPHLVALKILSRDDRTRPQDRMDLVNLLTAARDEDRVEIPGLLERIAARGFARGRDLPALYAAAVKETAGA